MAGYDVFQANQDLNLSVALVSEYTGANIDAVSATVSVYDEAEVLIDGPTAATITPVPGPAIAPPFTADFTVLAAVNAASTPTMRQIVLMVTDSLGNEYRVNYYYILETGDRVIPGTNSYAYFAVLLRASSLMQGIDTFNESSHLDKQRALISAYYNIGKCPVDVRANISNYQDRLYTDALFGGAHPIHPNLMSEAELALIWPESLNRLIRGQIREANFLLGDEPVLDRRRRGLISESHGEVTQFFRVAKPVELPVCTAALKEMTGLLVWNKKLARS